MSNIYQDKMYEAKETILKTKSFKDFLKTEKGKFFKSIYDELGEDSWVVRLYDTVKHHPHTWLYHSLMMPKAKKLSDLFSYIEGGGFSVAHPTKENTAISTPRTNNGLFCSLGRWDNYKTRLSYLEVKLTDECEKFSLGGFELIKRKDGVLVTTGRSDIISSYWLALLPHEEVDGILENLPIANADLRKGA